MTTLVCLDTVCHAGGPVQWITSAIGDQSHAVTETDLVAGIVTGDGRYRTVCSEMITVAAMAVEPTSRCLACAATMRGRPARTPVRRTPARRRLASCMHYLFHTSSISVGQSRPVAPSLCCGLDPAPLAVSPRQGGRHAATDPRASSFPRGSVAAHDGPAGSSIGGER